jgi:DNA-binding transcriptional MerR regulator
MRLLDKGAMMEEEVSQRQKKPYYRSIDDTLEDVDITRRQLSYWRKQGLFNPELGQNAKSFTRGDTDQLKFLKRLIVDLGLPVTTVKKLVDSVDEEDFWSNAARDMTYIDINNASLILPEDAMTLLIANAVAAASPEMRDKWFMVIALQKLRAMARGSATYEVYAAQKKAFFDRIERLDLLARFVMHGGEYVLKPEQENDPDLSADLIERLTKDKDRHEGAVDKARLRQIRSSL